MARSQLPNLWERRENAATQRNKYANKYTSCFLTLYRTLCVCFPERAWVWSWPPSLSKWDMGQPGLSLRSGMLQKKLWWKNEKKGKGPGTLLMWCDLVQQIVMMLSAAHQNTKGGLCKSDGDENRPDLKCLWKPRPKGLNTAANIIKRGSHRSWAPGFGSASRPRECLYFWATEQSSSPQKDLRPLSDFCSSHLTQIPGG